MARRYGGAHSPTPPEGTSAPSPWDGKRRSRIGARVNALFVAPVPLLVTAFFQPPAGLLADLAAFFVLMLAAWMTREGLRAQEAFEARAAARRPALPRKMLGAALTGAGLALAGLPDPLAAAIFAVLGVALHLGAFGLDPLRDKRAGGADDYQTDRVLRAVDGGEAHLAAMRASAAALGDPEVARRVEGFAATARRLFRQVEADPRELPASRRWLGVYLLGARDATEAYARLAARAPAPQAREDYLAFIDDLGHGFAQRTETLLLDDRADMDIEIDVLRDRLAREGVLADGRRTTTGD